MRRTKRERQRLILDILSSKRVETQDHLALELRSRGVATTQSSVSRDIVEMGLTKLNGRYAAPEQLLAPPSPVTSLDTAGDNLILVKTEVGQAQPVALAIDGAHLPEIVGTVAGDDTIMVAVKNSAAQRLAIRKIIRLLSRPTAPATGSRRHSRNPARRGI